MDISQILESLLGMSQAQAQPAPMSFGDRFGAINDPAGGAPPMPLQGPVGMPPPGVQLEDIPLPRPRPNTAPIPPWPPQSGPAPGELPASPMLWPPRSSNGPIELPPEMGLTEGPKPPQFMPAPGVRANTSGGGFADLFNPQTRDGARFYGSLGGGLATSTGNTRGGAFARGMGGALQGGQKRDDIDYARDTSADATDFDQRLKLFNAALRAREAGDIGEYRRNMAKYYDALSRGEAGSKRQAYNKPDTQLNHEAEQRILQNNTRLDKKEAAIQSSPMNPTQRAAAMAEVAKERAEYIKNNRRAPAAEVPAEAPTVGTPAAKPFIPAPDRPNQMTPGNGNQPVDVTLPPQPESVPPGSSYSPSRRQWRTPDGALFSEDGAPVGGP